MCRTCDNQREFVERLLGRMNSPDVSLTDIEQSRVILKEWRDLVSRAIELTYSPKLDISRAAVKVLHLIKTEDLINKYADNKKLPHADASQVSLVRQRIVDSAESDPARNKTRFLELSDPLWSKFLAHDKESGLRGDVVGWIEGFIRIYYRKLVEKVIDLMTHSKSEIRIASLIVLESLDLESLQRELANCSDFSFSAEVNVSPDWDKVLSNLLTNSPKSSDFSALQPDTHEIVWIPNV
ncbi:MAG TPA: hypothetical protein PKA63_09845 [Oligoflexia bacterium]|nr:hypothetical protein [Oligoflexia bacterium]HMP48957.1 hypothetical protein [Oligoflexia bacterium]